MIRKALIVAVLLALGAGGPAMAQTLQETRLQAEQGNANAQYVLGLMYDNGTGVPQDYAQAVKWYRLAADQGHASAQFNLGVMYYEGQGVPQSFPQALKWYRLAADQGHAKAQYNLGLMYGGSVKWFRKAADQGDALAQAGLGWAYATGRGVAQDYVQAHKWSNLSAASGNADALKNRDMIAAKMTPAQIGEAQRLASAWRKK